MSCAADQLASYRSRRAASALRALEVLATFAVLVLTIAGVAAYDAPSGQVAQYEADSLKTIVELQQFRRTTTIDISGASGRRGVATFTEINPRINTWFLLTLAWSSPSELLTYHLENPDPQGATPLQMDAGTYGIRISSNGRVVSCPLWAGDGMTALEEARRTGLPYAPVCDGRLYLKNVVPGTYTRLERVTNFLRDHVWGGDQIVTFVRKQFFRDVFAEKGLPATNQSARADTGPPGSAPTGALMDSSSGGDVIVPEHLGIDVASTGTGLTLGQWYRVNGVSGIYISAIEPRVIAPELLTSFRATVSGLDSVESDAVDYLVAFDMREFDLGFALGTDHPRVGWSGRETDAMHDPGLPGPDGIGGSGPVVRNGMVSPGLIRRVAATFAGGFKREHGAFRYGDLARRNHGSHYGFIEHGTVFSKLQPGLATVLTLDDGSVVMKTWAEADNNSLPRIRHARQNGVPLIDYDTAGGRAVPGALVSQWGAGNWSGSADEKLRTLRAGVCLQQTPTRQFLIYGYFSTATPSAMVRVFQAYGCRYAMHLDMNALEHTYLALYTHEDGRFVVQHLIDGMGEVDRKGGGQLAPRFLSFPDDRDFFYVVRHKGR